MLRAVKNLHGHKIHVGGRKRPIVTPATHPELFRRARKYLKGTLPTAPPAYDYFAPSKAAQADILGNDQLGDCTAAGACHAVEAVTAAAGSAVVLSRADAVKFYSLSTGYDPSDPSTDQGGDEVQVCTTWRDKGIDGAGAHAIKGWLSIDPSDGNFVRTMGWLFEILYFGIELDASWPQQVAGDGFFWNGGTPDPEDGHCVIGGGGDSMGIKINSWGFIGTISYKAVAKFCAPGAGGNLFAILTAESIDRAKGRAPSGFDFATLLADFDAQGGTVPAPPPAPPPSPDQPPGVFVDPNAPPFMPAAGKPKK